MNQGAIDWNLDVNLPVSGRTPAARHSSATGARRAARSRGAVAVAYRQLLIASGPLSDHEAAQVLGRLVSSINSTRNNWGDHVVPSGHFEATTFGTKRVRWAWRA